LAKERSAEDHFFGDKEKFVTAAYKRKLEEEKQWLAEEKLREAQEQKNDVVKKGHMGDFYRYSLPNRMSFVDVVQTLCMLNCDV
jgi:coiled-coil domain-containing protein 55